MAKNTAVEPRQTRDTELKSILCDLAIGQQRLFAFQDELSASRRILKDKENHHTGMSFRLADPGERPGTPAIESKRRKQAFADFKVEAAEIERLTGELRARQKEFDDLTDTVNKAQRRCTEIRAAVKSERDIRVAAAVSQASDAAPSRETYRTERERFYRLQNRETSIGRELDRLFNPPVRQANVETRAEQYRNTEVIPEETPEISASIKKVIAEQKLVAEAVRLQARVVRDLQRKYGSELAAALRPILAAFAQQQSDAIDTLRAAGLEADQLVLQAGIEAGTGDVFTTVRFGGIAPDYQDSSDVVRTWQTRMRIQGLLV
jgi:hypothetical protein